jgi:hypothetical protein
MMARWLFALELRATGELAGFTGLSIPEFLCSRDHQGGVPGIGRADRRPALNAAGASGAVPARRADVCSGHTEGTARR